LGSDVIFIGRDFESIKDDETGKQFKQNVEQKVNSIFFNDTDKIKFDVYIETVED
jgi:hypothetical protein